MARQSKTTVAMLYALSLISILGFIGIIGNTWFNFDLLSKNMSSIMLIVLGGGLIVEGKVKEWKSFKQKGISNNEIAHLVTGLVGIIALIVGLISVFGVVNPTLEAAKGLVASVGILIIIFETWVVDQ